MTTPIDLTQYEKHKSTIAVIMGHFMLRHLNSLYSKFNGDLILPIVLGEIAHHNIHKYFSINGSTVMIRDHLQSEDIRYKTLEPCNAFSISESTGIPRETVRRKIDKLVEYGWLVKGTRGEVTVSESVGDNFVDDFNMKTLVDLIETSECINRLLMPDNGALER